MDRRQFCQLVFGSVTFAIVSPEIKAIPKAIPPAASTLGLELRKPLLWSEGIHTVKIIGIHIAESKMHEGSQNIIFEYESLDSKSRIQQYFSDRGLGFLAKHLTKACGINPDVYLEGQAIDLNDLIGKIIDIEVKIQPYLDRQVNRVVTV